MGRVVPVRESRVQVERRPDGLHVGLPRRRSWWRMFMPFWALLILAVGLGGMLSAPMPKDAGAIAFLVIWVLIASSVFAVSLWALLAREVLVLDERHLTCVRGVGRLARRRSYLRAEIGDLRASPDSLSPFDPRAGLRAYGLGGGTIAFDYGDRTIRCGDVEEAEAKRVVAALKAEGLDG